MKNLVLITGASKGIGKALAEIYFKQNWKVITFSRTITDFPKEITQIKVDLTNVDALKGAFNKAFAEVDIASIKRFTLINNAGRLGKIANIENIPLQDIGLSIQLNVTAVMQMSGLFINKLQSVNATKNIISISSGAAINPYAGWSVYCASKAAVDMFTKTIALEQEMAEFPANCIGIRPGVVATDMQRQIRETHKKDFKMVDKFIDLYQTDALSNPLKVAEKIYRLDTTKHIPNGDIVDLRDL